MLLKEESIRFTDFIQLLADREINSLVFTPEINPESIAVFFSLICMKEKDCPVNKTSLGEAMKKQGVKGISFEQLVAVDGAKDVSDLAKIKDNSLSERPSYDEAVKFMKSVEQDVLANKCINIKGLQAVTMSLMEGFLDNRDAMMSVLSIKHYDEFLFHHSVNVAIIALLVARELSMPEDFLSTVGIGGLLHDIGKLKIPRTIIDKPGRLTKEEWTIMKRHPVEGANMLMQCEGLDERVIAAAIEHHAGYDLSGYPSLSRMEKPHVVARIISIADVYEAMTADRSYRPACNVQHAVEVLISGVGSQFDPLLIKLLLNTVGVFPPGSIVRLKNGQNAVVVEPNEGKPFWPKVQTMCRESEKPDKGEFIDTFENPDSYAVMGIAESAKV